EALPMFQKANANEAKRGKGFQPELATIGGLQWILSNQEEAMRTFKSGVDGVLDGTIQFGDMAGGMSHGLLLWFTGVSIPDRGAADYAHNYLLRLCKQ